MTHIDPSFRKRCPAFLVTALQLMVACGGSVDESKPAGSTGATSGTIGGNSAGGSIAFTTGGSAMGGSSQVRTTIYDGGAVGIGGAAAAGGAIAVSGAIGAGGSMVAGGAIGTGAVTNGGSYTSAVGGTTGVDCSTVRCAAPSCPPNATLVTRPGECCPTCVPLDASCAAVQCATNLNCPDGFEVRRLPGACCDTCYPTAAAKYPRCELVDCMPAPDCPIGYRHSSTPYRCCNDCEPDPNYCEADSDCLIARKPSGCCGCPQAVSTRLYAEDPCYSTVSSPRTVPASCVPQVQCAMMCDCPAAPSALCLNRSCVAPIPL